MPLTITHTFVSAKPDPSDVTLIRPSNWNESHTIAGTLEEAGLSLSDITTGNVTTARHGFAPKLSNNANTFLNGVGAWAVPPDVGVTSVNEAALSLTDITTANVTTARHGFAPKLPNVATQFLNGVGAWAVPAGSGSGLGDVITDENNTFTADNAFRGLTQFGEVPPCGNAIVTVHQTMNNATNSSMMDIVGRSEGNMETATSLVVISSTTANFADQLTGIYVQNSIEGGNTPLSNGIRIAPPTITGETIISAVNGLVVDDHSSMFVPGAMNIRSKGSGSLNMFEGSVIVGGEGEGARLFVSKAGTGLYPLILDGTAEGTSGDVSMRLQSASAEAGLEIFTSSTGGTTYSIFSTAISSSHGAGRFVITGTEPGPTGTGSILTINDGFVGIGTNDPAYRLDVDGDIHLTGAIFGSDNEPYKSESDFQLSLPSEFSSRRLYVNSGRALRRGNRPFTCPQTWYNIVSFPITGIDWTIPSSPVIFTVEDTTALKQGQTISIAGATGIGANVFNGLFTGVNILSPTEFELIGIDVSNVQTYTPGSAFAGRAVDDIGNGNVTFWIIADEDTPSTRMYSIGNDFGGAIIQAGINGEFSSFDDSNASPDLTLNENGVLIASVVAVVVSNQFVFVPRQIYPSVAVVPRIRAGDNIQLFRTGTDLYINADDVGWEASEGGAPYTDRNVCIAPTDGLNFDHRLYVDGDINVTGSYLINGVSTTQFPVFISTNQTSTVIVGTGRATVGVISEMIPPATFEITVLDFVSLIAQNPLILNVGGSTANVRMNQLLGLSGLSGPSANQLNGVTSGRVIGIDGQLITLDIDGTGMALDNSIGFVGSGGSQTDTVHLIAHAFDGDIVLAVSEDFPLIVSPFAGRVIQNVLGEDFDLSMGGAGVTIGTVTFNSGGGTGGEGDPISPQWTTKTEWNPSISPSTFVGNTTGIAIERNGGALSIGATGQGFMDLTTGANNAFWFNHSTSRLGLQNQNPDHLLDVNGEINCVEGYFLEGVRQFGRALPFPGNIRATVVVQQYLKFTASPTGAGGNLKSIIMLADQNYVQTLVSVSGGNEVTMVLRRTAGTIVATMDEVAAAWVAANLNTSFGTIQVLSNGSSVLTSGGTYPFSGGQTSSYTPTGGEFFFDATSFFVGLAGGGYGKITFDSII